MEAYFEAVRVLYARDLVEVPEARMPYGSTKEALMSVGYSEYNAQRIMARAYALAMMCEKYKEGMLVSVSLVYQAMPGQIVRNKGVLMPHTPGIYYLTREMELGLEVDLIIEVSVPYPTGWEGRVFTDFSESPPEPNGCGVWAEADMYLKAVWVEGVLVEGNQSPVTDLWEDLWYTERGSAAVRILNRDQLVAGCVPAVVRRICREHFGVELPAPPL